MFRIRLGKKTIGNNLVQNGDFSENFGSLDHWEVYSALFIGGANQSNIGISADTYSGNTCVSNISAPDTLTELVLIQPGIFRRGNEYRISFEIFEITDGGNPVVNNSVIVRMGDYSAYQEFKEADTFSIDRLCLDRGDIVFQFLQGNVYLSNITAYRLDWNDPLEDQPLNLGEDLHTTIEESENYNFQVAETIDSLTFIGDGYDYLRNIREAEGIDGIVPIKIEYTEDGVNFETYLIGNIAISDVEFDEFHETCEVDIDNQSAESQLSRNLDVTYNLRAGINNSNPYPARRLYNFEYPFVFWDELIKTFAPNSVFTDFTSFRVEELLRFFIDRCTNSRAICYSNIFGDFNRYGGLSIGFAANFETAYEDTLSFELSLKDILSILNIAFNIIIQPVVVDGVTIFRIEHQPDMDDETEIVSFENVKITRRNFRQDLVKAFQSGYQETPENTFKKNIYYDSGKIYGTNTVDEFLVPIVKIVGTGVFQDSDISNGDWVLYESGLDPSNPYSNNQPDSLSPLPYNYLRPYFKRLIPKSPNNPNLNDFNFPATNWGPSLPFSYSSATDNIIREITKSNSAYLEEVEFDVPISHENYKKLINRTPLKNLIVDPAFNSSQYWDTTGGFTVQVGRAAILTYSASTLYSILREALVSGDKFHLQVRIGGLVIMDDCQLDIELWTTGFGSGGVIATIQKAVGTGQFDDIYDIYFTNPLNNAVIIQFNLNSGGGSPAASFMLLEVNLFTTDYQVNMQKNILVNGRSAKIKSIQRNLLTGASTIEAYLKA